MNTTPPQAAPSDADERLDSMYEALNKDGFAREEDWFVKHPGHEYTEQVHIDTLAMLARAQTAAPAHCKGDPGECAYNGACMYACGDVSPAPAGAQPATKALEFAEYVASGAEQFIDAALAMVNEYHEADNAGCDPRIETHADAFDEGLRNMRSAIYEFRKRAAKVAAPPPVAAPAAQPAWQASREAFEKVHLGSHNTRRFADGNKHYVDPRIQVEWQLWSLAWATSRLLVTPTAAVQTQRQEDASATGIEPRADHLGLPTQFSPEVFAASPPPQAQAQQWPTARELWSHMSALDPSWNNYGKSREGAVELALKALQFGGYSQAQAQPSVDTDIGKATAQATENFPHTAAIPGEALTDEQIDKFGLALWEQGLISRPAKYEFRTIVRAVEREVRAPAPPSPVPQWQPIETAATDRPALLYAPPQALHVEPKGKPGEYRVAAPRNWTWATHWMQLPFTPTAAPKEKP